MNIDISGNCDSRLGGGERCLCEEFFAPGDVGASVAVVKDGELVVDLWGGHLDTASGPRRGSATRSSTCSPRPRR